MHALLNRQRRYTRNKFYALPLAAAADETFQGKLQSTRNFSPHIARRKRRQQQVSPC
jgi:hypothetical protein